MADGDKKVVSVGARLAKYIGSKATREKKLQAASMMAEFTLHDTLIILCYLGRDPDAEISSQARKNLIPAARSWYTRPDRPELPQPIYEIVMKVIEKVGLGDVKDDSASLTETVTGHIGLLGLGEIIQAVDHNNRTVRITLRRNGDTARVFTQAGKVIGAVLGGDDGLEALYKAFGWLDATFDYLHAEPEGFRNPIKVNTLTLVMDALEYSPDEDPFDSEISFGWKVTGHLKVMNIFEIAEVFEMNSRQAICLLKRESDEGKLFFNNGRIVNAALGTMTGMDAACHLLAWPNAEFVITRGGEGVEEVIHVGMQNLIIEAMRLLDEGVTVTDKIASELALIDELFEGKDVMTMPVLDKVRMVFADNEEVRDTLATDENPLVRKAVKVKISKTVHKYLSLGTEHELRLKAARGQVPMSTTEKLVLLSYLSHDEAQDIKEAARQTLESLDTTTYRKGFGADLHPSVVDFLVKETIREPTLIRVAVSSESLMEETALYVLDHWKDPEIIKALVENVKLLDRSPAVTPKAAALLTDNPALKTKIDIFEESSLQGATDKKVEGPLDLCGLGGLARAARVGSRSGTIVLDSEGKTGRIFIKKGKVIGAVTESLEGIPALEHMLGWKRTRFRFTLRTYFHVENLESSRVDELLDGPDAKPVPVGEGSTGMRIITGSLDVLDVYEALTALEDALVPMSMNVVCEEGSGEIYSDRNRILHAQVAGKEGPYQAMAAMVTWTASRMIIRPAVGSFPTTVDKPLSEFFTEAMKQIPEEMRQITRPGELPEWELSEAEYESLYRRILEMGVAEKIKLAFLGGKDARDILVRDPIKLVAVAVVKSPKIQESEIEAISKSRQVAEDVLRQIAQTKEWAKSYQIKLNLVSNPKTPVPIAMKFLPHIRGLELRKLAKDKNIPQVIASQARRLAETKGES